MSEELKPCPFCGGEAYINYERIPGEGCGFAELGRTADDNI